jgi:hypothetical protein
MRASRLALLTLLPLPALALEVEVTPGSDIRALTQSLQPGAIYNFADGVYEVDNEWTITGEGTEAEPIILRAARGARPVIRLTTNGSRVLRVVNSTHVLVQGLTFEHDDERYEATNANGIRVENTTDLRIDACVVRHTGGTGISMGGDVRRVRITGTEITDTRDGHGIYAGCGDASCWLQDGEIAGNLIHDIKGANDELRVDGVHLAPGAQGNTVVDNILVGINRHGVVFHSTEYGAQNVLEGNAVWNVGASGLWISGSALVRNNLAFSTGQFGLYSENNRDALENLVIAHNTFAQTGGAAVRLRGWAGKPGMVLTNNALANPVGEALNVDAESLDAGVYFAANVVTGSVIGVARDSAGFVPGGGYTDFMDVDAMDFYPRGGAVLRDAADPSGEAFVPGIDFNGFDRNGATPSVGALEYVHASNPGWLLEVGFKTFEDRRLEDEFTQRGCCRDDGEAAAGVVLVPLALLGAAARRRRRR